MSDYAHGDHRAKGLSAHHAGGTRVLYAGCYLLFLARAVIKRAAPWRRGAAMFGDPVRRDTVFSEAATAASVIVSSSHMGL